MMSDGDGGDDDDDVVVVGSWFLWLRGVSRENKNPT